MSERRATAEDVELVRTSLRRLADEVQPRGDALPRLLSAARRRKAPRKNRKLWATLVIVASAAAVFVAVLLAFPGTPQQRTEPVSVAPTSYLAETASGVIASFDVASGQRLNDIARVSGASGDELAVDGQLLYTVVSRGGQRDIVRISPDGSQIAVAHLPGTGSVALAARGGSVAYADAGEVVVVHDRAQQHIPIPVGARVADLALAPDGWLAMLTVPNTGGSTSIQLVQPGTTSAHALPMLVPGGPCGPAAVAWSQHNVAALMPCGSATVRVAILDRTTGEPLAAGAPFPARPFTAGQVRLSADRLGRFLVSAVGSPQWLVDASTVRTIPSACPSCGAAVFGDQAS